MFIILGNNMFVQHHIFWTLSFIMIFGMHTFIFIQSSNKYTIWECCMPLTIYIYNTQRNIYFVYVCTTQGLLALRSKYFFLYWKMIPADKEIILLFWWVKCNRAKNAVDLAYLKSEKGGPLNYTYIQQHSLP